MPTPQIYIPIKQARSRIPKEAEPDSPHKAGGQTPRRQASHAARMQPPACCRYPKRRDLVSGPIANVTAAATSAMATMPK